MPFISQPEEIQHPINCLEWIYEVPENPAIGIENGISYAIFSNNRGRVRPFIKVLSEGRIPIRLERDFLKDLLGTTIPTDTLVFTPFVDTLFTDVVFLIVNEFQFTGCTLDNTITTDSLPIPILNSVNGSDRYTFDDRGVAIADYPLTLRPKNYRIHSDQLDWIWSRENTAQYSFYGCDGLISQLVLSTTATVGSDVSVFPAGTANIGEVGLDGFTGIPDGTKRYSILFPSGEEYHVEIFDCGVFTNDIYEVMILEPQGGYSVIPCDLVSTTAEVQTEMYCDTSSCIRQSGVYSSGEKVMNKRTRGRWNFRTLIDSTNPEYGRWMQSLSSGSRAFIIRRDQGAITGIKYEEFIIDSGLSAYNVNGGIATFSGYLANQFYSKSWR